MSFIKKLITASALDLEDLPLPLSAKMVEESKGTSGSWYEEAEAPYRVYLVSKIELADLATDAPALLDDIKALKVGDYFKCQFTFTGDKGEKVSVGPETAQVKGLKWTSDDTVELSTTLYGSWEGVKPRQSEQGRDIA